MNVHSGEVELLCEETDNCVPSSIIFGANAQLGKIRGGRGFSGSGSIDEWMWHVHEHKRFTVEHPS
jgi:hypothetical protein